MFGNIIFRKFYAKYLAKIDQTTIVYILSLLVGLLSALPPAVVKNAIYPDNGFVLVGMAGAMAGVMHTPLTAIFLIAEITGGYPLLIPLIITSIMLWRHSKRPMHGTCQCWIEAFMLVLFQNQEFMQPTVNCLFSFQRSREKIIMYFLIY